MKVFKGVGHVRELDRLHEMPLEILLQGQLHVVHMPGRPARLWIQKGN